jgi:hypothetical protein
VYVVHPLRERSSVLRPSDTDGVFTDLTARLHPLFKDSSQVCNSNGAASEEAGRLFISILQSGRDEPFDTYRYMRRSRSVGRTAST